MRLIALTSGGRVEASFNSWTDVDCEEAASRGGPSGPVRRATLPPLNQRTSWQLRVHSP